RNELDDPVGVGVGSAVYEFLEGDVLRDDFVERINGNRDDLSLPEPDWTAVLIEEVDVFGQRVGECVYVCEHVGEAQGGEGRVRRPAHDVWLVRGAASAEAAAGDHGGTLTSGSSRSPCRGPLQSSFHLAMAARLCVHALADREAFAPQDLATL